MLYRAPRSFYPSRPAPPRPCANRVVRTSPRVPAATTGLFRRRSSAASVHGGVSLHRVGSAIEQSVDQVGELLPHQGILENFVHHNPLEVLQSLQFNEAIEYVRQLESHMSPGERLFSLVHVDPRKRVNEALVDLCSAFLDKGAAKWAPRHRNKGFLHFFASLENLGVAPWRKSARATAKRILAEFEKNPIEAGEKLSETLLRENLQFLGVPPENWHHAIRATMLDLKGWAGMFRRMETHTIESPPNTRVRLIDFCAVQFVLSRASIESLAKQSDWNPEMPLSAFINRAPLIRSEVVHYGPHASSIASVDQTAERRELLEAEMEESLLHSIGTVPVVPKATAQRPKLQLFTCIDDRECSFRRYMEAGRPVGEVETFGVAGFFGVPIRYQPADGRDPMILAPEGQNPTAVLVEGQEAGHAATLKTRRKILAQFSRFWEGASFSPIGSLLLAGLFPLSVVRLLLMGFSPVLKHTVKERFSGFLLPKPKTDFTIPFQPEQAALLLARTFKDVGTHKRFAPLVIVLGHGSTSLNNPFAAAYNCGACGGREGGPNARLLARMANDPFVRKALAQIHDIHIGDDTRFVGGNHNTTTDVIEFYDTDFLPEAHKKQFAEAQKLVDQARGKNALERCDRFLLAHVHTPQEALRHVLMRANDLGEVRPELNHATNGAVVIGRRDMTKGRFLNRRAFLPSYDPFADDDIGTNLEHVLAPALIVCSGINLEYLFSTIEVDHYGAGTKAPLNVVGNIGVLQGTAGDLRPGLPTQMTEMHLPVRALYIVDAPIARIEAVLARRPELRQLVRNDWVRFFLRDPATGNYFKQTKGNYIPVDVNEITQVEPPHHHHARHGALVAHREGNLYWLAAVSMVMSCALTVYFFAPTAMNPVGGTIAICATLLSLPVLAFSRRYLHGDFMFGRFSALCVGLLLGFNVVTTAPTLEIAMLGWSLFGFASTFLIGAYNDRPTVRNNATFAFAAYKISDLAMLVAATFAAHQLPGGAVDHAPIVAGALMLAALFKSSQFPLTSLFVRSMEGPTPASALGYAGLSAHVGVVLLAGTMPLWFAFDWARATLGILGLVTAAYGTLIAKVRADRKGAIANATSATLGLIYVVLALGHPTLALFMSLGHAAFRMIQILTAPNVITEAQSLRSALGFSAWPKEIPDWLYKLSWTLRRWDTDFHLINALHRVSKPLLVFWPHSRKLTKFQQWLVVAVSIILAGAPFTPVSHYFEHLIGGLLLSHPTLAGALMVGHFGMSVLLIRFLFVNVLHARRFYRPTQTPETAPATTTH